MLVTMKSTRETEKSLAVSSDISSGSSQSSLEQVPQEPTTRQDGGFRAWSQVLGCWLLFMNTWGLTNSFSIFETYYNKKFSHISHSNISWIGSMQLFLTLFVGVFAGWLLDRGYLRSILVTGISFEVVGMMMTSVCNTYWQLLLAQGICVGVGSGTLAFTSAAIIPFYFTKRRMLAAGIVSTGSSIAGVVYPLMMRELFNKVGFGWAVRILAFVMLGGLSMSLLLLKPHTQATKKRAIVKSTSLRDTPYTIFIFAYAFMVAGVYVPYFFIQSYALDLYIDESMTFNVVSIMNAATFFGRFPYNYLADMYGFIQSRFVAQLIRPRYGGIAVLVPCCLATSIILFFWRFTHDLGGLITISATFCFVTGGLVSLPAVTIANLTQDKSEYGTRMGMGYTVAAIGALLGNPIAGLARNNDSMDVLERWQGAWFVAGGALLVATALMIWARAQRAGFDMSIKI